MRPMATMGKSPRGKCSDFGDTRISLKLVVSQAERSICAKNELDPFSRFDTIPACDRQTDTGSRLITRQHSVVRVKSTLVVGRITEASATTSGFRVLLLLAICRPSGCTAVSGVVVVFGVCNRSQMRTSKYACLIFGVSIGLDPGQNCAKGIFDRSQFKVRRDISRPYLDGFQLLFARLRLNVLFQNVTAVGWYQFIVCSEQRHT